MSSNTNELSALPSVSPESSPPPHRAHPLIGHRLAGVYSRNAVHTEASGGDTNANVFGVPDVPDLPPCLQSLEQLRAAGAAAAAAADKKSDEDDDDDMEVLPPNPPTPTPETEPEPEPPKKRRGRRRRAGPPPPVRPPGLSEAYKDWREALRAREGSHVLFGPRCRETLGTRVPSVAWSATIGDLPKRLRTPRKRQYGGVRACRKLMMPRGGGRRGGGRGGG
ncbi:hypothetical protein PMIN06_010277 [Paraphaeosphaeria minitans]|uniref:Uncharacterized protein n=1 Tax=Paraphaeosphaeria minitans TaxID=565426 RepID=A0A9P6KJA3_9PLEO|nr:hypothetical protein PMIN01_13418 [Paraphaeosphaeria minitans]